MTTPPAKIAELEAGQTLQLQLGRYRLRTVLGEAGFGQVWLADRVYTGSPVAIKVVNRARWAAASKEERAIWPEFFAQEIGFLTSLDWRLRTHVVSLLDQGTDELGFPAFALELMAGSLATRLSVSATRPVSARATLGWMGHVARALEALHDEGRLHLDLKPGNVLVAPGDRFCKLADFGTLMRFDPEGSTKDHTTAQFVGTPGCQAPEQGFWGGRGGYLHTPAADVFALGLLTFTTLTRSNSSYTAICRPLFRDRGLAVHAAEFNQTGGIMGSALTEDDLQKLRRGFDSAEVALPHALGTSIRAFLVDCLQWAPDRRPTAAEAVARLEDLKRSCPRPALAAPPRAEGSALRRAAKRFGAGVAVGLLEAARGAGHWLTREPVPAVSALRHAARAAWGGAIARTQTSQEEEAEVSATLVPDDLDLRSIDLPTTETPGTLMPQPSTG